LHQPPGHRKLGWFSREIVLIHPPRLAGHAGYKEPPPSAGDRVKGLTKGPRPQSGERIEDGIADELDGVTGEEDADLMALVNTCARAQNPTKDAAVAVGPSPAAGSRRLSGAWRHADVHGTPITLGVLLVVPAQKQRYQVFGQAELPPCGG
jgi:hypothetical protein